MNISSQISRAMVVFSAFDFFVNWFC